MQDAEAWKHQAFASFSIAGAVWKNHGLLTFLFIRFLEKFQGMKLQFHPMKQKFRPYETLEKSP